MGKYDFKIYILTPLLRSFLSFFFLPPLLFSPPSQNGRLELRPCSLGDAAAQVHRRPTNEGGAASIRAARIDCTCALALSLSLSLIPASLTTAVSSFSLEVLSPEAFRGEPPFCLLPHFFAFYFGLS